MSGQTLQQVVDGLEQGLPPGPDAGYLGARLPPEHAALVLIPVPWEATTSYGGGTSRGPAAIVEASHQMDLEDRAFGTPYRAGITFLPQDPVLAALNESAREPADRVIVAAGRRAEAPEDLAIVNAASRELNHRVATAAGAWLDQGKAVGLVGGDHSSPEGLIRALCEREQAGFAVLHFDAHHDLRAAYEGFEGSHAAIMYNLMETCPKVSKLVSVAIRDYSRGERRYMESLGERGRTFYAADLYRRQAEGASFAAVVDDVLAQLPQRVYVSFDIDALDPPYCPHTGTPVPGGLSFDQAGYFLERLGHSGRQLVGFDLCEVAPGPHGEEWDANVGARLLYKLCGCLLRSRGLC